MSLDVPTLHAWLGAAGVALAGLMLSGLGAVLAGADASAETRLVAGWGAFCAALTLWAVTLPFDLRAPLFGLLLLGAVGHALRRRRPWTRLWHSGAGRVLLLTLPLWAVMLPARPAEIDTWWNLLPNAAYLFDHGGLPVEGGPESYSFLPAAPYNTQFVAFAASVFSGGFAEGALGLFNLLLLCAAALLVARVLAHGNRRDLSGPVLWWACALGCLIVVPLNPGFVPRALLSPYGETGLAVTTLFAVWLATDLLDDLARGARAASAVPLALTLAAMVNVKQSGIGLVLPVGLSLAGLAAAHPNICFRRAAFVVSACLAPSLALYAAWRLFVAGHFPSGELRMLAMTDWHWRLLPRIFGAIVATIAQKAAYFGCLLAVMALVAGRLRRRVWDRQTLLLGMVSGVAVLFVLFLVFSYVAHFDAVSAAEAHSFYRYTLQLSLAAMLALACAARPFIAARVDHASRRTRRKLGAALVAVTLGLPAALAGSLRFDLEAPQPTLWALAQDVAARLEGRRLALLLPGDVDDGVGSLLRGVVSFVPPRHIGLDFAIWLRADPAALAAASAAGYAEVFVSCSSAETAAAPGLAGLPEGVAALVRRAGDGWSVVQLWRYPSALARRRFSGQIERAPLCGGPVRDVSPAISWHRSG